MYSQKSTTCPYAGPDEFSPHNTIPFLLTLFSNLQRSLTNGLLPSGFPIKTV